MSDLISPLFTGFVLTGDLSVDAPGFLRHHGREGIARHVEIVAAYAREMAARAGLAEPDVMSAAWLHDISRVLPYGEMVAAALHHEVALLPEEICSPQLIHGKLSAVMAEEFFGVRDPVVLDAIRCHTTLRPNPTLLDKVLFIADKRAWAPHEAPYHAALEAALAQSLDRAVACFLDWSWQQRYPVIHPWLRQAYEAFCLQPPTAEQ